MSDAENGDTEVVAETQDTSAPLEEVTSSPQQGSETQETASTEQAAETTAPSEFDHLKALEGLQLDPKTKELLKSGYLRQADYTKKTQALAADRKLIDEYKTVRPVLEFLDKNPELFNEVVRKMQTPAQPPKDGQEQVPDNPKEFAEWVKQNTIKEMLEIQGRDADFQRAAKVDPRLDADPEFGEMVARMVAQDPEFRGKQISAEAATAKAVKLLDGYIKKQVSTSKLELSNKAKARSQGSTARSVPGTTQGVTQPRTIAEAAKMAEEELN